MFPRRPGADPGGDSRRGGVIEGGLARLNEVIRGYARAIASDYGWCMVRAEDQDLGPETGRHIKALKSGIDQGIRRLIRAGIEDGSIEPCDAKIMAFAMAGALNWIAHWYRENQPLTAERAAPRRSSTCSGGVCRAGRPDLAPQKPRGVHSTNNVALPHRQPDD